MKNNYKQLLKIIILLIIATLLAYLSIFIIESEIIRLVMIVISLLSITCSSFLLCDAFLLWVSLKNHALRYNNCQCAQE